MIAERAEKAAIIVTPNLSSSEWPQVFTNARLCKAVLDRLGHIALVAGHFQLVSPRGPSKLTSATADCRTISITEALEKLRCSCRRMVTNPGGPRVFRWP